jgi:DinB superfamily
MSEKVVRDHVVYLLRGGGAHIGFDATVKGIPPDARGKRPARLPYSAWEILEHMRIAQWDILEFSRNAKHQSPKWPEGYWPASRVPPSQAAWAKSVRKFKEDLEAMCALVMNPSTNLYAEIPHGEGQTVLREALLVADHNSYHLGQMVLIRRLLGAWK